MAEYEIVDEPPNDEGRHTAWVAPFADWLRMHPGKWAKGPRDYAGSTQVTWYLARLRNDFGCEAVSRLIDGRRHIYARYLEPD